MKKTYCSLLLVLGMILSLPISSTGQNLMKQLGGIFLDLKITSGPNVLSEGAYLIKRANYFQHFPHEGTAAYESMNIEFSSNTDVVTVKKKRQGRGRDYYYSLTLIDTEGKKYNEIIRKRHIRRLASEDQTDNSFHYSIDLVGIPIIVLKNIEILDLQYIDEVLPKY